MPTETGASAKAANASKVSTSKKVSGAPAVGFHHRDEGGKVFPGSEQTS